MAVPNIPERIESYDVSRLWRPPGKQERDAVRDRGYGVWHRVQCAAARSHPVRRQRLASSRIAR